MIVKAETNYILPECGFTAPADQEFKAWQIGGTEYKVGDSYTVLGGYRNQGAVGKQRYSPHHLHRHRQQ